MLKIVAKYLAPGATLTITSETVTYEPPPGSGRKLLVNYQWCPFQMDVRTIDGVVLDDLTPSECWVIERLLGVPLAIRRALNLPLTIR